MHQVLKSISRLFLVLLLTMLNLTASGQVVHNFTIYFEENSFDLSETGQLKIDSVLQLMNNTPKAYAINIIGHTDNVGNVYTNNSLSLQRASSTANHFTEKGFLKEKISYSGEGFSKPVDNNNTEEGKANNRRVDITISVNIPKLESFAGLTLKEDSYQFEADKGTLIEHRTGTSILIPPDAFVDAQGRPVSGEVKVTYQDYRDPIDFILAGIPMSHVQNDELYHFNSAGMFQLLAYQNENPLSLKEGKEIQMDYVITEDLEKLNFYSYDSLNREWKEVSKLTNQNQSDSIIEKPLCGIDADYAFYLMINRGIAIAKSEDSEIDNLILLALSSYNSSPILTKIRDIEYKMKKLDQEKESLFNSLDRFKRSYNLEASRLKNNKATFKITCRARKLNELNTFNNIIWKYSSETEVFDGSIFNRRWDDCQILPSLDKGIYNLRLRNIRGEVEMNNLEMVVKDKIKKDEQENFINQLFEKYDSTRQIYQDLSAQLDILNESDKVLKDSIAYLNDSLAMIREYADENRMRLNSLICFWEINKQYITGEEYNLNMADWLVYFKGNKDKMLKRYTDFQNTPRHEVAKKVAEVRQKEWERREKANQLFFRTLGSIENQNSPTTKQLRITNLGIHNCDQIIKEINTIELLASYKDAEGNQIKPLFVCLVDDSRNGMVRYDGYLGYSPYRFKYNPESNNTLVAMDEKLNTYLISSEQFASIESQDKKAEYTFTVEEIDNLMDDSNESL